jgi:hypothetical protein
LQLGQGPQAPQCILRPTETAKRILLERLCHFRRSCDLISTPQYAALAKVQAPRRPRFSSTYWVGASSAIRFHGENRGAKGPLWLSQHSLSLMEVSCFPGLLDIFFAISSVHYTDCARRTFYELCSILHHSPWLKSKNWNLLKDRPKNWTPPSPSKNSAKLFGTTMIPPR